MKVLLTTVVVFVVGLVSAASALAVPDPHVGGYPVVAPHVGGYPVWFPHVGGYRPPPVWNQ